MVKIAFMGDIFPFHLNKNVFTSCQIDEKLTKVLELCDFRVANLEVPITIRTSKILKDGGHLRCHPQDVGLLKNLQLNLVSLANNHIMDYGAAGLMDTFSTLGLYKIMATGAGKNLKEATLPFITKIDNLSFGFISCCEKEFSIATPTSPGAAPFSVISLYHQITQLKKDVDFVIILFHGGLEHFDQPLPQMRDKLRFMIDIGADCVISHHTHVFSSFELYNDRPIFYGLGNLIFPKLKQFTSENYESCIAILNFGKANIIYELIPTVFDLKTLTLRAMDSNQSEIFFKKVSSRNTVLSDDEEFIKNWKNYVFKKKNYYSPLLSTIDSKIINKLRKMKFLPSPSFNSKRALRLLNALACDAHNETLSSIIELSILKNETYKNEKF